VLLFMLYCVTDATTVAVIGIVAVSYSHLSKFVQYPGMLHLEAVERVLQYVRATYDLVISLYDLRAQIKERNWEDRIHLHRRSLR